MRYRTDEKNAVSRFGLNTNGSETDGDKCPVGRRRVRELTGYGVLVLGDTEDPLAAPGRNEDDRHPAVVARLVRSRVVHPLRPAGYGQIAGEVVLDLQDRELVPLHEEAPIAVPTLGPLLGVHLVREVHAADAEPGPGHGPQEPPRDAVHRLPLHLVEALLDVVVQDAVDEVVLAVHEGGEVPLGPHVVPHVHEGDGHVGGLRELLGGVGEQAPQVLVIVRPTGGEDQNRGGAPVEAPLERLVDHLLQGLPQHALSLGRRGVDQPLQSVRVLDVAVDVVEPAGPAGEAHDVDAVTVEPGDGLDDPAEGRDGLLPSGGRVGGIVDVRRGGRVFLGEFSQAGFHHVFHESHLGY